MSHGLIARVPRCRSISPGPSDYYISPRFGTGVPAYTIGGRHEKKEQKTSPGFVGLESTIGKCPGIKMKFRHPVNEEENTPGPSYLPKSFVDETAPIKVSPRYGTRKIEETPGPGEYTVDIRPHTAGFKIKNRVFPPSEGVLTPGPAAYAPNFNVTRKRSPSPPIGVRTFSEKKEITPGPSDYEIKRSMGGLGMSIHIKTPTLEIGNTPGPGQYVQSNTARSPAFTIGSRYNFKKDVNQAEYVALESTVGKGPKISMHFRTKVRDFEETPGPNYLPPSDGMAKPVSIGNRYNIEKKEATPGPGAYQIPQDNSPKIVIKGRNFLPETNTVTPGPGKYSPDYQAVRKSSPRVSIKNRIQTKSGEITPGPYEIPSSPRGPLFTIGRCDECDVAFL